MTFHFANSRRIHHRNLRAVACKVMSGGSQYETGTDLTLSYGFTLQPTNNQISDLKVTFRIERFGDTDLEIFP